MANISTPEAKYQKLASEYSKLRAQAGVLKKAVLDEQAKNATIRDQLRQRETSLRRTEQEVDSLGFRNKQLEHRVAALQDELAMREGRKVEKEQGRSKVTKGDLPLPVNIAGNGDSGSGVAHEALIFEELQKKIMENAQLTSLNDDKVRELQLHAERVASLEQTLEKQAMEQTELEKRLRRDLDALQSRNSELETKLVEAASMLGSEDALSVSGSDTTPLHGAHVNHAHLAQPNNTHTSETERIAYLEQEVSHWRTQYEIAKINALPTCNDVKCALPAPHAAADNCSCSSSAAGLTVMPSYAESKSAQRLREQNKDPAPLPTKEQLLHNNFSMIYEDLLKAKCVAESRLYSFQVETSNLQSCLDEANEEIKAKEENIKSMNRVLQLLEEDLATTRVNYEEQISVLTEQVISLSEQLAACK